MTLRVYQKNSLITQAIFYHSLPKLTLCISVRYQRYASREKLCTPIIQFCVSYTSVKGGKIILCWRIHSTFVIATKTKANISRIPNTTVIQKERRAASTKSKDLSDRFFQTSYRKMSSRIIAYRTTRLTINSEKVGSRKLLMVSLPPCRILFASLPKSLPAAIIRYDDALIVQTNSDSDIFMLTAIETYPKKSFRIFDLTSFN